MNAAKSNSSPSTQPNANTESGVPPGPPEALHRAGGVEQEVQCLAAAARSEIDAAKALDGIDEKGAWAHEVAAWDLAYRVGFDHPELQEPPADFAGSRTLQFGWARGRTAAILSLRCR